MDRILITGGAGFIGSHACLLFLEKGYRISVIDSFVNSSPKSIERVVHYINSNSKRTVNSLDLIKCDLRNRIDLERVFIECKRKGDPISSVIHFAGLKSVNESIKNPLEYWDCNVNGTINLLKIMEKFNCYNIVFSSSATIYGHTSSNNIKEDSSIKPINPYGQTKAAIERILSDIANSSQGDWSIANLRYFNPIGAHPSGIIGEDPLGIPNNIFPIINRVAARRIKELKIFGKDWPTIDGTAIRDYIHVMDLAKGHLLALEFLLKGKRGITNLNIGTGKGTSVLELVNIFQSVNNIDLPYVFTHRRDGDTSVTVADNSLALKILQWRPERNLQDMCRDGWKWQCTNPNGYE